MAEDILKDSRFTKYLSDPRYRQIPRHERKVKIDKRFQSMFKDDKFKVKYTVDKRGRPVNETSTENLRRYYDLESESDSSEEDEGEKTGTKQSKKKGKDMDTSASGLFVKRPQSESESADEESVKEVVPGLKNDMLVRGKLEKKIREKLHDLDVDYARGEGLLQSDSSSDGESSDDAGISEEDDHGWGQLDADAETTEDATRRLAVCNMDWDNMKASDILVLFNSFVPPGGVIHKVTIYPSEFGLKRMQEEEVRGPIELTEKKEKENDFSDDGGDEEGSSYDMEKLRRYQLNRLKYYYAVVECDSVATADKLYTECDGMEYESSATKLDLRFVPDDTTFDQEPKEVCTKLPDLSKYKPRLFTTTALQQAKVELTWDTTNPGRTEAIRNALGGQIDDLEIKEYLASSSEDDEEETKAGVDSGSDQEEDPILKYKSLLLDIQDKEEKKKNKDMEMEITWGLGVKEKAEELVKKSQADNKNLTPFEKIIENRREKKKQKKLERKQKIEQLKSEQGDDIEKESSDDDIPSDVDMNDPYFAEEFNKPEFKKKKQKKTEAEEPEGEEEAKIKAELELLLDDEDDGKAHFSLKKIQAAESESKKSKRKRKLKEKMKESKQAVPDFDIDVNDERFSALFRSHHFNIDPTDPNYKKTKNMEKLIQEKLKRRPAETDEQERPGKKSREDVELSLLVKNIKRKTKDVMKKQKIV